MKEIGVPMGKLARIIANELKSLRFLAYRRGSSQDIVEQFHKLYYDVHESVRKWKSTLWLGVPALKCPLDLWVYQEILYERRPQLIIETGTAMGGGAYFLASMFDLLGFGRVVSIDIEAPDGRPDHPRIRYIKGSSIAPQVIEEVRREIGTADRVMVILDSDHRCDHVLSELRTYGPLVTRDQYLIVEDSNINGHPVLPDFGPGPMEAIDVFIRETDCFVVDSEREKYYMTFNPRGYLKKVR